MPDQIAIIGISGTGHHGVLAHERAIGQEFVVDVVIDVDTLMAAQSDQLADTVDYSVVAREVYELIVGPAVDLIETLAELISDACLAHRAVLAVEVRVHKPQAPIDVPFRDVEVRIRRSRDA